MSKRISAAEAAKLVRSGDTVASVGVIGWITPDALLRGLADRFRASRMPRRPDVLFSVWNRRFDRHPRHGPCRDRRTHARICPGYRKSVAPNKQRVRNSCVSFARTGSRPIAGRSARACSGCARSRAKARALSLRSGSAPMRIHASRAANSRLAPRRTRRTHRVPRQAVSVLSNVPAECGFHPRIVGRSFGNLSYEDEALLSSNVALALAVKASGGIVIAQVRHEVPRYSRPAHHVRIPGALVDHYVVEPDQMSGTGISLDRGLSRWTAARSASLPVCRSGPTRSSPVAPRRGPPGRTSIFGFGASSDVPLVMAEAGLFDDDRLMAIGLRPNTVRSAASS